MQKKILLIFIVISSLIYCNSISLNKAIEIAIEKDTNLKKLKIQNRIIKTQKKNIILNYIPDVSFSQNYEKQKLRDIEGEDVLIKDFNSSINVSMPLFYTNKNKDLFDSYGYSKKINNNKIKIKANSIKIHVMILYFNILKNMKKNFFWKMELENAENRLKKARKMLELDRITEIDYLENKYYYSYVSYNLKKSKYDFNKSVINLEQYLNLNIKKVKNYKFTKKSIQNDYSYFKRKAMENNPEYKNIGLNYKMNKKLYSYTKKRRFPEISVFFNNNYNGDKITDFDNNEFTVGVNVDITDLFTTDSHFDYRSNDESDYEYFSYNINFLTGNNLKIDILSSKKNYLENQIENSKKQKTLEKKIKNVFYDFINSRENLEVKKEKLNLQKEKKNMKLKKYSLDMIDDEEKVESIKEYSQAKLEYLDARFNYIINYYKLLKEAGMDIKL